MFLKIVSIIGSLTFLSRILGYCRDFLIALSLGASYVSDAFFVAFKLPNLFRRLFAEGAMNSAFVPLVSGIRIKEGAKKGDIFLSEIFTLIVSFLLPFIILFEIFMPTIINIFAPGFENNENKFVLAIELARLTFPFLLFICITSLFGGYLNTMSKFAAMAFTPVILNLVMLSVLLACYDNSIEKVQTAKNLSFSISIAGLLQLIWLYINLKKINVRFLFLKEIFSGLSKNAKKLLILFFPAVLGSGVYQLNLLIDMILASTLPDGSISYLYFADRVNQLPLGVFGIALSTALLPILSKQIKQKNAQSNLTINNSVQLSMLFSFPAACGLMILSIQIIDLLFVRGEFSFSDGMLTSEALVALSFGLPAFIFVKILAVVFFARGDTKTPVVVAFFSMIVNLVLNLILIDHYFHVGLAYATSAASWFNCILLYFLLKKNQFFYITKKTSEVAIKCIVSSVIMMICLENFINLNMYDSLSKIVFYKKFVFVLANILFGFFIYLILIYFLKIFYLIKFTEDNGKNI